MLSFCNIFLNLRKGSFSPLYRKITLLLLVMLTMVFDLQATHLRAGQITVTADPNNPRGFWITVEVWTNTRNTSVLFGGDQDILDFGDLTLMFVPETQNQAGKPGKPALPPGVAYASFTVYHEYIAGGVYTVSYREPNRNEGVLNMDASVNTQFYLETQIVIDPFYGLNNSPRLEVDPIDRACPGVAFTHNPGAYDPDPQDSISYALVIPFSNRRTSVLNYRDPNDPRFYEPAGFPYTNEAGTQPPDFNINELTGTITWDAPGAVGEYNIAFHVIEWRKVNGRWRRLGYVRRDMQIIVEDCDNERPDLEIPPDTCVVAGSLLDVDIIGTDPDGDKVKIEAFSPILEYPIEQGPASINPNPGPGDYRDVPATTEFTWQTQCSHVRAQPYAVVFKVTDNPPSGTQLATFKTWFITVVGPPPQWNSYDPDDTKRHVTVRWDPYTCANAQTMQVWRKVDGADFEPSNCETGMPEHLGYELVGTVNIGEQDFYTDTNNGKGLIPGARYCYRLVAVFPQSTASESLVSEDLCIEPFDIVTPVITNVSVVETSDTNGSIDICWTPPIDLPPAAYVYRVFRRTGFTPEEDSVLVDETTNLCLTDNGLDTDGTVYNYVVSAYINTNDPPVGTSAAASSVRIEAGSRFERIELSWNAVVPWSNNISGLTHKIYRGDAGATNISQLNLLADVNVTQDGFFYVDTGLEDREYCYLVETYGSYGNPDIPSPLINRSQIVCAMPGDTVPPCKPPSPILADGRDCRDFVQDLTTCQTNDFTNILEWTRDDQECNDDIAYYNVYYSNAQNGTYTLLATNIEVPRYEDKGTGRTSFAACYRIAAVDRSGNISEMSDPICFENCPHYELPNVFTPNGDDCNDYFSAYSDRGIVGENGEQDGCVTPIESRQKCARFVEKVVFHVYNRWGREVYTYTGRNNDDENHIYIDWDGISNEGQALATGVYYYVAEVTFVAIDPAIKYQTIKGWVHLVRDQPTN